MMNKNGILIILLVLEISFQCFSAAASPFRKNTATIMFGGVIGAGAGLGSLIFYSNPQSHTENLTTGLLIGLLGGVIYVATQKDQTFNEVENHFIQQNDLFVNASSHDLKSKNIQIVYPLVNYSLQF